jgi:hypothetical protein
MPGAPATVSSKAAAKAINQEPAPCIRVWSEKYLWMTRHSGRGSGKGADGHNEQARASGFCGARAMPNGG